MTNADLPMVGLRRASKLAALAFLAAGAVAAWHWRMILDPATISAAIARYPTAPLGFLAVHIAFGGGIGGYQARPEIAGDSVRQGQGIEAKI